MYEIDGTVGICNSRILYFVMVKLSESILVTHCASKERSLLQNDTPQNPKHRNMQNESYFRHIFPTIALIKHIITNKGLL